MLDAYDEPDCAVEAAMVKVINKRGLSHCLFVVALFSQVFPHLTGLQLRSGMALHKRMFANLGRPGLHEGLPFRTLLKGCSYPAHL